jgi:hypothetical protein
MSAARCYKVLKGDKKHFNKVLKGFKMLLKGLTGFNLFDMCQTALKGV